MDVGKKRIPIRTYVAYGFAAVATILWVLFYYEVSRGGITNESLQNNRSAIRFILGIIPILMFWLGAELYNVATLNRDRYKSLTKKINQLQGELDQVSFGDRDKFMNSPINNTTDTYESTETEEILEQSEIESEDIFSENQPETEEENETVSFLDEWNMNADTLIRAFNLPNDENDTEGYDAIEAAVKIESIGTLLQNSHQLLYTLADFDLIMDELEIDLGLISTWRKFAADNAESTVSSLGGTGTFVEIDKVSSIVTERSEFEELANTFSSQMEEFISQAIPQLKDEEIRELAQTRTFRAFLLLGQVTSPG